MEDGTMRSQISRIGLAALMMAVFCVGVASAGSTLKMRARLRSETAAFAVSGTARYAELGPQHKKFSVEVEGFVPGSELEVFINDAKVGVMKVDELGVGDLNYDTRIHPGDEDWQQFPIGFPELHTGDVVTVGRITGTMQGR
jgi:hypothetical protein